MKNALRFYSGLLMITLLVASAQAHIPPVDKERGGQKSTDRLVSLREDCNQSRSSTDMDVNNVRARLLGGGDVWWDLNNGRYIYPKVDPASGQTEVSAIFAAAVWLGGFDDNNNLKVAAQTYRQQGNDFWPGPLVEATGGTTNQSICERWDRHFIVYGVDIDRHLLNWTVNKDPVTNRLDNLDDIPRDVLYWPSFGNPYFVERDGFELPDNKNAGLADFFDQNGDGIYDPADGDFPKIGIRGCPVDDPRYPDQMVFWIYNDAGGIHTQTQSPEALRMEVQVQAFAYATNDEINDMTFQRYKLINRGLQPLDSTYFALWVDPDLGCHLDDYIGCDITLEGFRPDGTQKFRDLMYVYNEDALDGEPGCNCPGGVPTYCDKIPILGIDYFRGPLDLDSITGYEWVYFIDDLTGELDSFQQPTYWELGMSSFTYYNNRGIGNWPNAMTDPDIYFEYYRYMSGSWKDGTRFTFGGSGYNVLSNEYIQYALIDAPDDPSGWSMCTASLDFGDRRTLQSSGPFVLKPGAINELIVGVVAVPDQPHPCPSLDRLLFADGIAQALFDNCFAITDGPDAPDMDWIELDQRLIAVLTNTPDSTFRFNNNSFELYESLDLRAPTTIPEEDRLFRFEGYKIYQLVNANVGAAELRNPDRARLVQQVDIRNGISKIYNWREESLPGISEVIWLPTLMVDGQDMGIRHTFVINEDLFSTASIRKLINHRDYYYMVVAYAHNSYGEFLPSEPLAGQRAPYLEGRRNIKVYKATPRPITDLIFKSDYGDGFQITRLDGAGAGGNFLELADGVHDQIFSPDFDGAILYKSGRGPINVKVFNPFAVKDGTYRLVMEDPEIGNARILTDDATWRLEYEDAQGNVVVSRPDFGLSRRNEQVFREYGISITIEQTPNAGVTLDHRNGLIGGELEYADPNGPKWYQALRDGEFVNFMPTHDIDDPDRDIFFDKDPNQAFKSVAGGLWYPYVLTDFRINRNPQLISPAWIDNLNGNISKSGTPRNNLQQLRNVDIVFTADRSKWSRCIVVETGSPIWNPLQPQGGNIANLKLRAHPSLKLNPDATGNPDYNPDTLGLGWFPGYAIDVETGQRLNIFYGENSRLIPEMIQNQVPAEFNPPLVQANTRDMVWNPTSEEIVPLGFVGSNPIVDPSVLLTNIFGGQHTVYVSNTAYDGCDSFRIVLNRPGLAGSPNYLARRIMWTSIPYLTQGTQLLSWANGLIPNDLTVKLRVDRSYAKAAGTLEFGEFPAYEWVVDGKEAEPVMENMYPEVLAAIDVVPNPYYGLSYYENNEFATTVKITNLPARATISIYTLDGKFIRRFQRNEVGAVQNLDRPNAAITQKQIFPNLEWDLRNDAGIPIASGIYLIHVEVPGVGSRTLKWFGVQRQFDPSKL